MQISLAIFCRSSPVVSISTMDSAQSLRSAAKKVKDLLEEFVGEAVNRCGHDSEIGGELEEGKGGRMQR